MHKTKSCRVLKTEQVKMVSNATKKKCTNSLLPNIVDNWKFLIMNILNPGQEVSLNNYSCSVLIVNILGVQAVAVYIFTNIFKCNAYYDLPVYYRRTIRNTIDADDGRWGYAN